MKRREFITLVGSAVAAWPVVAWGQQVGTRRIAVLMAGKESDQDLQARITSLKQGLERLGWRDGRNIQIDVRFAEGAPERFQPLAKELIALQPSILMAHTPPVVAAVRRESGDIPLVFVDVSDPISPGFIESVARPGGNTTGMLSFEAGIVGKWLAMMKEIAPSLSRVMMLGNSRTTAFDYFHRAAAATAQVLGVEVVPHQVTTGLDLESAVATLATGAQSGLMILPDTAIQAQRELIIGLAARHRMPAIYPFPHFVRAGGLMSYSHESAFQWRLAASSIDRILHGTKPGDIPAQAPTKFEMVLNLKTANALSLPVPAGLLVAADEVIE